MNTLKVLLMKTEGFKASLHQIKIGYEKYDKTNPNILAEFPQTQTETKTLLRNLPQVQTELKTDLRKLRKAKPTLK